MWLLNGAHSILAFEGLRRGLTSVAEAIADVDCRGVVDQFWAEAVTHLPEGIEHRQYRHDLVARFSNHRIAHRLRQIALDSTLKCRYRIATVARLTIAAGQTPHASAAALAAWVRATREGLLGEPTGDGLSYPGTDATTARLIHAVSPELAADESFLRLVDAHLPVHT